MLHVLAATTRAVTEDVVFDGVLLVMVVAFLLFLAGLEIDFEIIRGRPVNLGLRAFALSVALGILVTLPLGLLNVIADPLFIGIVLTATSLGIVIPVLKDAAQLDTGFGHFVVRGAPALLFRKDISRS